MAYFSTKMFGPISTNHRQWKHQGHCAQIHGYGRHVKITFGSNTGLDERGWIQDFGDCRYIKKWLEDQWDHKTLIAEDDPHLEDIINLQNINKENPIIKINVIRKPYGPGIELSCRYVFDHVNQMLPKNKFVQEVEIWEHENNSAKYVRSKTTNLIPDKRV